MWRNLKNQRCVSSNACYGRNSPAHPSFVKYPAGHARCDGCDISNNGNTTFRLYGDLKFNFKSITAPYLIKREATVVRVCWSTSKLQSFDANHFDKTTKWSSLLPHGATLPPSLNTVTCKMRCLSIIYVILLEITCTGFSSALLVQFIIT